jgi:non-specific serine/threonine protein kinase
VKEASLKLFLAKLRKRHIIETLAAFIGGGWLIYEIVERVLVLHYKFPEALLDITLITLIAALISTILWRWFSGTEKRPGNVKAEVLLVPLIVVVALAIDLNLILQMAGVPGKRLLIGIIAFLLGIAWIVFKSLQWAAIMPESEKKEIEVSSLITAKPEKSIVVLPFVNISPEEGQDYFCDGMTEEIITDLSHIHDLLVISRSSAMTFKGTEKTIPEIARAVNVRYVLEGSVRKSGNNLRIAAQLIDAETDVHLWADKYSGTLDDVFDIQDKVSHAIVAGLKMRLAPDEERKIVGRPLANAPAYDCYLRAKQEIARWTEPALDRALHYIEAALEMAGESAYLLAGFAQVYAAYVGGGFRLDDETRRKAEEYARRTLALDSTLAPGHSALGVLAYMGGDPRHAFAHLKRAVAIEQNDANSVYWFVTAAVTVGRSSASRPYVGRLLQADPLNPVSYQAAAEQEFFDGRFETALVSARTALRLDPDAVIARYLYALSLAATQHFAEAHAVLDQWKSETPEHPYLLALTSWVHALEGHKTESSELLAKLLINKTVRAGMRSDGTGVWVGAEIYAMNGNVSEALEWLQHGLEIGAINYPFLSTLDPWLDNIRGEPRFKKLMERVKYEWEHFEV